MTVPGDAIIGTPAFVKKNSTVTLRYIPEIFATQSHPFFSLLPLIIY